MTTSPSMSYPGRVAVAIALATAAAFAWVLRDLALLIFGGVLFAVALSSIASLLLKIPKIGWRTSVIISVVLVLALVIGLAFWLGNELAAQAAELRERLPQAIEAARSWLASKPFGSQIVDQARDLTSGDLPLGRVASGAALAAGALGNFILMLLLGVFFAIEPTMYKEGAVRLFPVRHRGAVGEAIAACGEALRGWLKGQGLSMLFVGMATSVGLWLLGVPLALILGVVAGVLDFVPFFGPIVSGALAVLLAFTEGPQTALYVALLGLAIQQLEGNVVMPLVQRWAVQLPPAVGLVAVVIAATLFGIPGILLATPLMVVCMVLVRELYVKRALENHAGDGA
jgi:predicted PurR-regulated permease PerM